jgi:hypothetical protein
VLAWRNRHHQSNRKVPRVYTVGPVMHEHGYFSGTYPNRRHVLPWWQVATGIRTQRNPIKKNEERMKKPEIKSSRKPCNQIYATCIFLEERKHKYLQLVSNVFCVIFTLVKSSLTHHLRFQSNLFFLKLLIVNWATGQEIYNIFYGCDQDFKIQISICVRLTTA